MPLTKEQYQAFESIVGPDYISDDPALLDSYTYPLDTTSMHMGPCYKVYTPRGLAVLLPGSTEEVQAIVRLCNKYKLKFKASSTFWSPMGYPSYDDCTIQLDMRRMDRILQIDEKNMYAVVEPHCICSQLQAECMKVGLNCHIQGPGTSCSPLASATSYGGMGPDTIYMGAADEIVLGAEWVMPDGEICRFGSWGSGLEGFYGEGPGPSIKGLMRGAHGCRGAFGVYTRCALKLSAWPGPSRIPVKGTVPAYQADLPDNFHAYTLAFPTWKAWADAAHMIWDAGIGYIAHRQFNMFGRNIKVGMLKVLTDPTKTLNDLEEFMKDPEVLKATGELNRDFQFVLAGMTPRDMEWQEAVLEQILKQTGGYKAEFMENSPELRNWALLYLLKLGHKNLNLVFAGGYDGCFGLVGPPDYGTSLVEEGARFKDDWENSHDSIVSAGGDAMMGGIATIGGGGVIVWENFTCWDPFNKESTVGAFEFFEATSKYGISKGWGPGMERGNAGIRGNDGYALPKEAFDKTLKNAPQPVTFEYMKKFRETFDPNHTGDTYYQAL
ncbi:MAG: FAD-binding oxidoreductase [Dehalococcoidales bacterium]|nr:FAD-binding oxidoreductase [Dehalococcoidales bacterium]